jgi:CRISPR/Cas system-associated exonuclease Cas4 (RecB family)
MASNPAVELKQTLAIYHKTEDDSSDNKDSRFNRASSAGWFRDCQRHLVLLRLEPDKYAENERLRGIFRAGRDMEVVMRNDLELAGAKIITTPKTRKQMAAEGMTPGEIEAIVKKARGFYIPELSLKGEFDEKVLCDVGPTVVDYKSASPQMFSEVKRYDVAGDLALSTFSWIRHYPYQQYTYEAALHIPQGVLIFRDKVSAEEHFIYVPWNPGEYDSMAEALAEVNKLVEDHNIPPAVESSACRSCGFFEHCFPESSPSRASGLVQGSDELVSLLIEREKYVVAGVKKAAKELEDIEEAIKLMARQTPGTILAGDWVVSMEAGGGRTEYIYPPEIKAQYKRVVPNWKPIRIKFNGDEL